MLATHSLVEGIDEDDSIPTTLAINGVLLISKELTNFYRRARLCTAYLFG